jgi:peptidoglycan-associated lipoprotein
MSLRVAVLGVLVSVSCAHAPKPEVKEVAPPPPVIVAEQPPAPAKVVPPADLDAALGASSIAFGFDSAQLSESSLPALQKVAKVLKKNGAVSLRIEGNCDDRGTEEYNLALGNRRAEAARKYLTSLGVSAAQLDTISYGALRPLNPAQTEEAWAQNRRDDLKPVQ